MLSISRVSFGGKQTYQSNLINECVVKEPVFIEAQRIWPWSPWQDNKVIAVKLRQRFDGLMVLAVSWR